MDFHNILTNKILSEMIDKDNLLDHPSYVITEGIDIKKFYNIIKTLLSMEPKHLLDMAEHGGDINEDIIEINTLLFEDEDFAHVNLGDDEDEDMLGMPTMDVPTLNVQTTISGNYAKVLKVSIRNKNMSFVGYVPVNKNVSNNSIFNTIKRNLNNKQKLEIVWYNDLKKAMSVMTDIENTERKNLIDRQQQTARKDDLNKTQEIPKIEKQPLYQELASKMLAKTNPEFAERIKKMSKEGFRKAVAIGKQSLDFKSSYKIFKSILLTYLSFAALIHGVPGIAALVVAYLATRGIDRLSGTA